MAEFENSVVDSDDWYTPKKYFDAIGLTYDLDPSTSGSRYSALPRAGEARVHARG